MLETAMAVSKLSDHDRFFVGAVIVKGKRVVSVGMNQMKSHPKQKHYNQHRSFTAPVKDNLHAEMTALIKADNIDLNGATIYVARTCKHKPQAMARPCKACMKALQDSGIRDIVYTTDIGIALENIKQ